MNVGGQAVVEGVMMRNKERYAVAVRLPNGKIKVKVEKNTSYSKIFSMFFIRGMVGLAYQLSDGLKSLIWSSNQQLEQEEKMTPQELLLTIGASLLGAIVLFVLLPFFAARFFHTEGVWFNVLDGIFRVALFLIYLSIISMMKDVRTLFQYHGAEHKAIYCYEANQELSIRNVKKFSRFHPRCGTSFIFIVLLLSIFIFSFISGAWYVKLLGRIILIPIIAGIGYELIKLSDRFQSNIVVRMLISPGLWLQRITTKEPTQKQIEVGIKALLAVVE